MTAPYRISASPYGLAVAKFRQALISGAIIEADNNLTVAGAALGLTVPTLKDMMRSLKVKAPLPVPTAAQRMEVRMLLHEFGIPAPKKEER